jgi:hypothetical protein
VPSGFICVLQNLLGQAPGNSEKHAQNVRTTGRTDFGLRNTRNTHLCNAGTGFSRYEGISTASQSISTRKQDGTAHLRRKTVENCGIQACLQILW